MSRCARCHAQREPGMIKGMRLDLPVDWAILSAHGMPGQRSRNYVLCTDCVRKFQEFMILPDG